MGMKAESIKNILAGVAIDFIESEAKQRSVYLYSEDVKYDDTKHSLPANRVIEVIFKYSDNPNPEYQGK